MNFRIRRDDQGISLITAMLVGLVLTGLAVVAIQTSVAELGHSHTATERSASFQAAEAGIDDYLAKLTEDHVYYAHFVHPGESTRKPPSGANKSAGERWPYELTWTYPNGRNAWRRLDNGFEFNLQITPPAAGSQAVRIVSTGREIGATTGLRSIEVLVRSASVSDFQMIANADISYGETATTRGKIYAGIDSGGTRHSITHDGTAYSDLYAENRISGSTTYRDGARGFSCPSGPRSSCNISTAIKNPINFNNFTISLVDIKRAAQNSGGIYLDSTSVDGWRLVFRDNGTVDITGCKKVSGNHLAETQSSCNTTVAGKTGNFPVPAIGAIYVEQQVIISRPGTGAGNESILQGRVTVASNADVIIGGHIRYKTPGTDVLGLIARNDLIVAEWVPSTLNWVGATIAQTGQWRSYDQDQSHATMNFTGSTATNKGGYMSMFATRNYNYDPNLLFLQPPFFPVLEEAYTVLFFREIPV
jgi:hypothetical protein